MKLAELRGHFPFGVVLVTDEKSTEPIPNWSSPDQQVTVANTAMVIKIQHEADGPAVVRVWDDAAEARKVELATVALRSPSRAIVVSTAAGERSVRVPINAGNVQVKVLGSRNENSDEIDLVLTPSPSQA